MDLLLRNVTQITKNFLMQKKVQVVSQFFECDGCHQFLHFNSAHSFHNKNSIVYSQGLRIKRLCLSPLNFKKYLKNLKTWFCKRGYPQKLLDAQRTSEKSLDESFGRLDRKETAVPLVVTYHPCFHKSAILRKYLTFFYVEEKVKRVFTPPPFVSFRSSYSLRNDLVRAKVYPLIREM